MKKYIKKFLFLGLIFLLVFFVSEALGSHQLAIVLLLILFDKTFLSVSDMFWQLGIETLTVSIIFSTIFYGPVLGFFTGFLVVKLFDVIRFLFFPPKSKPTIPVVPSVGSFILGVTAIIFYFLSFSFPFPIAVLVASIIKNAMFIIKELLAGRTPFIIANILNVVFNYVLAIVIYSLGIV